jgi:hypothetical protein
VNQKITYRTIQVEVPADIAAGAQRVLREATVDPAALAARIATANTPENVAALYERLAQYKRNRLAVETAVSR